MLVHTKLITIIDFWVIVINLQHVIISKNLSGISIVLICRTGGMRHEYIETIKPPTELQNNNGLVGIR